MFSAVVFTSVSQQAMKSPSLKQHQERSLSGFGRIVDQPVNIPQQFLQTSRNARLAALFLGVCHHKPLQICWPSVHGEWLLFVYNLKLAGIHVCFSPGGPYVGIVMVQALRKRAGSIPIGPVPIVWLTKLLEKHGMRKASVTIADIPL